MVQDQYYNWNFNINGIADKDCILTITNCEAAFYESTLLMCVIIPRSVWKIFLWVFYGTRVVLVCVTISQLLSSIDCRAIVVYGYHVGISKFCTWTILFTAETWSNSQTQALISVVTLLYKVKYIYQRTRYRSLFRDGSLQTKALIEVLHAQNDIAFVVVAPFSPFVCKLARVAVLASCDSAKL